MACSERLCVLPGISNSLQIAGYASRGIVAGKDISRESSLVTPREGSRDYIPVSGSSAKGRVSIPNEIRDAIIMVVRKEQATLFNEFQEQLRSLSREVEYINTQLQDIFKIIPRHAGGQIIDMEVPDALRSIIDKADFATKTLAVHEARLQESEGFLQELACLQREFASKVNNGPSDRRFEASSADWEQKNDRRLCQLESELKSRLDTNMSSRDKNDNDTRLSKIEHELSELQGHFSRDNTLCSAYGVPDDELNRAKGPQSSALCTVPRRARLATSVRPDGDLGHEMENENSSLHEHYQGPVQHVPWFAQFIHDDRDPLPPSTNGFNCTADYTNGIRDPLPPSTNGFNGTADYTNGFGGGEVVGASEIRLENDRQVIQDAESDTPDRLPQESNGSGKRNSRLAMPKWMTSWRSKNNDKAVGA